MSDVSNSEADKNLRVKCVCVCGGGGVYSLCSQAHHLV